MEALLPLILTFGLMWALLIRPQQRRVRQHLDLVATLAAGDEVITTGGIVGTISGVVDDIVTLEVAPGTSIRLLRSAVQTRIAAGDDNEYLADEYPADDDSAADDHVAEDIAPPPPPPPPPPPSPPPAPPAPDAATEVTAEYIPPPPTEEKA